MITDPGNTNPLCRIWEMDGMSTPVPVQRRMLAAELRRLRERKRLTLDQVADRMSWSVSKVSRIENARIGVSTTDVRSLLGLYDVSKDHLQHLLAMAGRQDGHAWWRAYAGSLDEAYVSYIDAEAIADIVSQWQVTVIPGLLQTETYARHLLQSWQVVDTTLTPRQVEDRVETRMRRQERLTEGRSLRLTAIIDESVLLRRCGDRATMHAQLVKLLETSELPNVTLRVLPLDHDHRLVPGSFTVLDLGAGDEVGRRLGFSNVGPTELLLLEEQSTHEYCLVFDRLAGVALTADNSRELIAEHARAWQKA